MQLKIWDKQTNLIFPDGIERTPEQVYQAHPFARYATVVINDGVITYSIDDLNILKDVFKVTEEDSELALLAILEAKEQANAQSAEPNAEDRIAAALEFQNLLSL